MKPWDGQYVIICNDRASEALTDVNDELENLQHGDVLLPPDANTTGTLEVVPVHDNVNQQVDSDGNPLHGGNTDQLSVAQKGGGTVVVGVEEGQWLLLEDQEDGVNKLDVFVEIVELSVIGQCFLIIVTFINNLRSTG